MAASDAADGKRSLFRRGINATRLVLAFAVTVVIVTVVVYAIVVVSREEKLALWVTGSRIYVRPQQKDPALLGLTFTVVANNPSGRVRFYYTNITARLMLKNGTNSTDTFTFAKFFLGDDPNIDVAPVSMLQTDADTTVSYTARKDSTEFSAYFNELHNNKSSSIISDALLKLNGTLTVGLYSVHNKTSEQTVYYCSPLTIGAASNASADVLEERQCQTDDPWE